MDMYREGVAHESYFERPDNTTITLKEVKDLETGTVLEETLPLSNNEIMPDGCLNGIKPYSKEAIEATVIKVHCMNDCIKEYR
ncbi:hypothetical protein SAMD00019534_071010 [Acytostelium subglobosum LB1]|uniref:hypothetical protein n=1 Tax=Acytostelium subglobosum LB1 TaxID=1410327 RepID=UPI000644D59E|nr:hypothetical protein SAMD00019534_071010 [Acytostelium subglobosum LB1]GAM23926.1 hypothetical protein SAMD00019534_071010 [Acytostelium subglobosum LB1]|eukprot:XP_012752962.1 hypothetical protein SAMD00019534_071010 [Acytostelium subglobosum LB1]